MPLMSMSILAEAKRSFIRVMRLCPPASIFASSLECNRLTASLRDDGA